MSVVYVDDIRSMSRLLQKAGVLGFCVNFNATNLSIVLKYDGEEKVDRALQLYKEFLMSYPPHLRQKIHTDVCAGIGQSNLAQR